MWDWSGSKTPPPVRTRSEEADDAQNQGITPVRREPRSIPVYRDPRAYRTLPPTAPASSYTNPLDMPAPQTPYSMTPPSFSQQIPPVYSPQQPYTPQTYSPQTYTPQPQQPYAPQTYSPQTYAPQPQQPYAPQTYSPQTYAPHPQQPYAPQTYSPQTYAPQPQQPYAPQTYSPQTYAPQPQQPYAPQTYSPQTYAPQPQQAAQMPASNAQQEDKSLWEWQFQQTDLFNMDLIEVEYVPLDPVWLSELRKAFKRTRRDFLKYVGYHHVNELLAAGMSEDAIKLVKKGKAPENFNVHIRVPFTYGGTNSFSNLVLLQTHPFHTEIHRFIDMQTLGQPNFTPRKLFLPSPKGKVYFPGEVEVSSGGTSRHDRSVYAGFLESTFEMIAQQSVLGR